jgi:hypothetical protein
MPGWRTSLANSFVPNSVGNANVDNSVVCVNYQVGSAREYSGNSTAGTGVHPRLLVFGGFLWLAGLSYPRFAGRTRGSRFIALW